jgi:DNA processing protein
MIMDDRSTESLPVEPADQTAADPPIGCTGRVPDSDPPRADRSPPGQDRSARMALSCIADAGDPVISREVERVGAVEVLRAIIAGEHGPALAERARRLDLTDYRTAIGAGRFRFIVPGDADWPEGLSDLAGHEPIQRRGGIPYGLWLRGPADLTTLLERSVAVVGSRASSGYGDTVAGDLGYELADAGWTVVSGGAFGIDAAAHRGALSAGGPTIAVLACGVDVAYPPGNSALLASIGRDHLLVSELPPGAHPTRVRFLSRNRLIAAMTVGTIVVEAAIRSGARNTANWAALCNRRLLAVPGSVYSALSATPHLLIRDAQATMITNAADALEMLSSVGDHLAPAQTGDRRPTDGFDETRLAVYEAVPKQRYRTAGEIALLADVSMPRCLAELAALADAGMVRSGPNGWRLR